MTTPKRSIAALLSAGLLLTATAPVMAQGGAGDQQYQDPLGQTSKPKPKKKPKLVCKTRKQKRNPRLQAAGRQAACRQAAGGRQEARRGAPLATGEARTRGNSGAGAAPARNEARASPARSR